MWSVAFYLILSWYVAESSEAYSQYVAEDENAIFQKYVDLDKKLNKVVDSSVKALLPYILESSEHANVSFTCSRDVFKFISDVRKLKLSAFRLLDACGKIQAGALTGNFFMYGDYDECLATTATRGDGVVSYRGRYCMVRMKPRLPQRREKVTFERGIQGLIQATQNTSEVMQYLASIMHYTYRYDFKLGVCVPSGCSTKDINTVAKYIGEKVSFNATVAYCDGGEEKPMSTGKIIAVFFFSLFGLLSMLGTVFDYYTRIKDVSFQSFLAKLLLCFSVLRNFPIVISTQTPDKSLSSLFGIRSLSLFYIILLHNYFFNEKFVVQAHMLRYKASIPTFFLQIIINGFLTTEVFIFLGSMLTYEENGYTSGRFAFEDIFEHISPPDRAEKSPRGFVHSYSVLKYMEKSKRRISYVTMIVHRLLRLYPPYLFVMMSVYLLKDVKGPITPLVQQTHWDNCDKYWWYNLIFINNFFNQEDMCLFHGWYVAADMHLFLISMFTVPLLAKNPKKGVSLHLFILLVGLLSTSLWAWHKNILPALVPYRIVQEDIAKVWNAYTTTFPHIAPYFAGILLGYVILTYKDIKIHWVYQVLGWPVSGLALTSMLFMTQRWNSGVEPSILGSALYFSFSRIIYVGAVGWMILCCAKGCGGVVNYILSLRVWVPISRISYMMFLVSPVVQTIYISHRKMLIDSDDVTIIWRYFGDLLASFLLALVMVTLIESPFVALENIIFRRSEKTKDVESTQEGHQVNNISDGKLSKDIELENNFKNTILVLQSKE